LTPLWILETYPPDSGGLALAGERISRGLQEHFEDLQRLILDKNLAPGVAAWDDVRQLVRLGPFPEEDETLQFVEQYIVHNRSVSLVHAFAGGTLAAAAVAAALRKGVPSVVSLRGNDLDRGLYRGKTSALLRWTLEKASRIVCLSREQQAKLASWFGLRDTVYIPNAVDSDQFFPEPAADLWPDKKVVLVCAEMRWKKGLQLVLEVAQQAQGRFLVVLAGGIRKAEKAALRQWRLQFPSASGDLLELPWEAGRSRMRQLYARADLVWLPSLWEGMPNVVLEAMACGRPVLAHAVGGVPDLLLPGLGWALPLDQIGETVPMILQILQDPSAGEVGDKARQHVLVEHSLERERSAYRELYSDCQSLETGQL